MVMSEQEIYNKLDNGWIYVIPQDPYFENVLFKHIHPSYKIQYREGYLVKKTKSFYDRLISIGFSEQSLEYDSSVVMYLFFAKEKSEIKITLFSLKQGDDLHRVVREITGE